MQADGKVVNVYVLLVTQINTIKVSYPAFLSEK